MNPGRSPELERSKKERSKKERSKKERVRGKRGKKEREKGRCKMKIIKFSKARLPSLLI